MHLSDWPNSDLSNIVSVRLFCGLDSREKNKRPPTTDWHLGETETSWNNMRLQNNYYSSLHKFLVNIEFFSK